MWKNPKKIPAIIKKEVNSDLGKICSGKYYDEIPLGEILEALEKNNVIALQEDGTPWEGILCGERAQTQIDIGAIWSENDEGIYTPCDNSMLVLSWYRMQSGRYEINAYVS